MRLVSFDEIDNKDVTIIINTIDSDTIFLEENCVHCEDLDYPFCTENCTRRKHIL